MNNFEILNNQELLLVKGGHNEMTEKDEYDDIILD